MKRSRSSPRWLEEFEKIKNDESFIEFYSDAEDKWLQYSDWGPKIKGIFESYKNAVLAYQSYIKNNHDG